MLSLPELERVAAVLDARWRGARVDRVVAPEEYELVLELAGGEGFPASGRRYLLLSWRPHFGRAAQCATPPARPPEPLPLAQYLKPRLVGARLRAAELRGRDRQLALRFEARETGWTELVLALMGPRSNLYVLDRGGRLTRSARSLADTRRDLEIGAPYRDPAPHPAPEASDRFAEVPEEALLTAIEAHYAPKEERERGDRLRARLAQVLRRQRAALERRARALERDAQQAERAPQLEREGELLKSQLKTLRPGATEAVVHDYESGENLRVPLDPKLSPAANLEAIFRRARKAARVGRRAAMDLETVRERRAALEELEEALAGIPDFDKEALAAFAERPEVARLLERRASRAPTGRAAAKPRRVWKLGKRELPARLVPRRYRASGGLEIWVGRSDEGNDILTTRLARGRDLFFHLEGSPGSHVVLRVEKAEPPQEALLEAAELAVQFSKQKKATRASVHVARIKDVSKPRGAKPGLVYVHRGRTLDLRRDPKRLARVLEARIEE